MGQRSPLVLGAVASLWRDIAWSTPSLWINLTLFTKSENVFCWQLDVLRLWFENVRGLWLYLNFGGRMNNDDSDGDPFLSRVPIGAFRLDFLKLIIFEDNGRKLERFRVSWHNL